jgi:hypothetical protein
VQEHGRDIARQALHYFHPDTQGVLT